MSCDARLQFHLLRLTIKIHNVEMFTCFLSYLAVDFQESKELIHRATGFDCFHCALTLARVIKSCSIQDRGRRTVVIVLHQHHRRLKCELIKQTQKITISKDPAVTVFDYKALKMRNLELVL